MIITDRQKIWQIIREGVERNPYFKEMYDELLFWLNCHEYVPVSVKGGANSLRLKFHPSGTVIHLRGRHPVGGNPARIEVKSRYYGSPVTVWETPSDVVAWFTRSGKSLRRAA